MTVVSVGVGGSEQVEGDGDGVAAVADDLRIGNVPEKIPVLI